MQLSNAEIMKSHASVYDDCFILSDNSHHINKASVLHCMLVQCICHSLCTHPPYVPTIPGMVLRVEFSDTPLWIPI